ncbi:MAG: UDP-N-acetylmuramate dehydrogenase [Candidatus Omnitrophica bacterium]|nr:UDP-N-acetylmuramate dehydrogenase [Candidatus Omnitrophota bacterium]
MDLSFLNDLNVKITLHAPLSSVTTFCLGGPCLALIECHTASDLTATVQRLHTCNVDFLVMGFGANILASDHGVERVIVRYSSTTPAITCQKDRLTVAASTQLDDLILFAIKEGLEGLTVFSGIPGTVGGAIAGNAGAYGLAISDALIELTLLKPDGRVTTAPKSAVTFSYRDSTIKHNGDIILSAVFELKPGKAPRIMKQTYLNLIAKREGKHGSWKEHPSAGSFFRNVSATSKAGQREAAGWYLDQAGAKQLRVGGAHTLEQHANIITRDDGATAQDVYDLTLKMAAAVKEKFGIELVREARMLGKFDNAPGCDPRGFW